MPWIEDNELGDIFWKRCSEQEMIDANNEVLHESLEGLDHQDVEQAAKHINREEEARIEMRQFMHSV